MFYTHTDVVTILVLVFTTLVGVPGNALVLWVTGVKMRRSVTTIWFGNLALADITCCLCLPFTVVQFFYSEWPYNSALCKLLPFIIILNMFSSVFTLVAISVDRCILVVQPVWAQNHRKVPIAWMICLAIWMLSIMMGLPSLIYQTTETYGNITLCFPEDHSTVTVTVIHATFGFLVPLTTISACYISVAFKAQHSRFLKVGRKTTKVALGIIVAFFISWAPYHIMGIVLHFSDTDLVFTLDHLSQSLAQFNSCINPILYVFIGKDLKQRVRQSVRRLMETVFREEPSTLRSSVYSRSQTEEGTPVEHMVLEANIPQ